MTYLIKYQRHIHKVIKGSGNPDLLQINKEKNGKICLHQFNDL